MSSPSEPIRAVLEPLRRAVRAHRLWRPGDALVLGVSAGVDSMVAWDALLRLAPSLGHTILAVHVDHGLRDDTDTVRAALATVGARHEAPWHSVAATVVDGPQLESRARAARYAALHRVAAGGAVVTAHHADDQAEMVAMRLFRGAGAEAQQAARWRREDGVVRPLLALRRAEILAYARAAELPWVEDPSNLAPAHERTAWRHTLLPAIEAVRPGAGLNVLRATRHAADAASAARHWVEAYLERSGTLVEGSWVLRRADVPTAPNLLWPLLQAVSARLGVDAPGLAATEECARQLATPGRRQIAMHRICVELDGESARFSVRHVARSGGADYLAEGGGPLPQGHGPRGATLEAEPEMARPPSEPTRRPS